MMSASEKLIVRFTQQLIRFKYVVLILMVFLGVGIASGAQKLGFDTNYRVFFSEQNPQLLKFDELQKVYTKSDNAMIFVKPKNPDVHVFDKQVLEAVLWLTEQGWQVPYATRVDSITNFQHTYAEEDDLIVADLVYEDELADLTPEELNRRLEIAQNEPLLKGLLISKDGKATGVNTTVYLPEDDSNAPIEVYQFSRDVMAQAEEKFPELTFALSGVATMNANFALVSQMDMGKLVPIMYALLVVGMFVFLRSFTGTLATVVIIGLSAGVALGLTGFIGIHLTPISAAAPTIILTLAIADSIHVLVTMFHSMRQGMAKNDAIVESLRINFLPVFLTSLTTVIGFMSLNFSDAPPFRHLGNITAMGVVAAFVFSIILLPVLMSILPVRVSTEEGYDPGQTKLTPLGNWVIKHKHKVFAVMVIASAYLLAMIPRIELNDEFVKYFDESLEFRQHTDMVTKELSGTYTMDFSLKSGAPSGISSPEYLQKLEEFSDWLYEQPKVQHVYSLSEIFKRLNKNMHGDNPDYFRLPADKELSAQYLLMYEMSLPQGLDLNDRVNIDKSASRLTVTLDDLSTVELRALKKSSEQWLKENTPEYMHTEPTSPVVMFSYISERNIESMLSGTIVAFLMISVVLLIALRSVKMGVISLIPNMLPLGLTFGIWAITAGQVNMSVAIIAATSLGIIVDDTVHFLSKYIRARREKGLSPEDAVRYSFSTVGTALVVTTATLVAGFIVLMWSVFQPNGIMGMLTALAIVTALVVDFLLLPVLLLYFDKNKQKEPKNV